LNIDALAAAAKKGEGIEMKAKQRQQLIEKEVAEKIILAREEEETEAAKEEAERAAKIAKDELKLAKIVEDKNRREQDAEEAIEARRMAMEMVKKNKAKKEERKRAEALLKAKAKIEQKTAKLDAQMKIAEKNAIKKAKAEIKKRKKKEMKDAKKTLKMNNKVSEMNKQLKDLEVSAHETKKRLKEPHYKVSEDSEIVENDGDEINQIHMRANALMRASDHESNSKMNKIQTFDDSIVLDFGDDVDATDLDDLEIAEERRLKIEENLVQSKKRTANKRFTFQDSESAHIDNITVVHARAAIVFSPLKTPKSIDFDDSLKFNCSESENICDVEDLEEKRLEIERNLKRAQGESNDKQFNESFIVADNLDLFHARAAAPENTSQTKMKKSKKKSELKEKKKEKKTKKVKKKKKEKVDNAEKMLTKDDKEKKVKKKKKIKTTE